MPYLYRISLASANEKILETYKVARTRGNAALGEKQHNLAATRQICEVKQVDNRVVPFAPYHSRLYIRVWRGYVLCRA